jgi:predicted hydrolase (HD superfamily)
MRPSRSVLDLEVKSVRKKFKQQSFAAGVNREVILKGCEMLGMDLNDIILETIAGMRKVAAEIGLQGNLQSQV